MGIDAGDLLQNNCFSLRLKINNKIGLTASPVLHAPKIVSQKYLDW